MITKELLKSSVQFEAAERRVQDRLERCRTSEQLARFLIQYASWNGVFANGVVALTARIGAAKTTFIDPAMPWQVADRSNLVASYIFDAARDEFDDSIAHGVILIAAWLKPPSWPRPRFSGRRTSSTHMIRSGCAI
jgi:hypothetical protein